MTSKISRKAKIGAQKLTDPGQTLTAVTMRDPSAPRAQDSTMRDGTGEAALTKKTASKGKGKRKRRERITSAEDDDDDDDDDGPGIGGTEGDGKETGGPVGETGAVDEDSGEEYQPPTAEIETLDSWSSKALISYARIDVLDPRFDIRFGQWNRRPLVETQARDLAKSIMEQKFRPFASDSLLPLILPHWALDESTIHTNPNVEEAPMLTLSTEGVSKNVPLIFGGGRHRRRATEIIIDASEDKVKRWTDEVGEIQRRFEKAKEGSNLALALGKKLRLRQAQIEKEREVQRTVRIWGVAVYREDMMNANGGAGARHISSNEAVHHYVAGPAERMDRWVGDYEMYKIQGVDKLSAWLVRLSRGNSKIGQLFNHLETIQYLEELRVYRPHYTVDAIYSVPFCSKNIHGIFGGIFVSTVLYGTRLLQGLFSPDALHISDLDRLDEYKASRTKREDAVKAKSFKNVVVRTWNQLLKPVENLEEREVGVDFLTSQLSHLDAIFDTHFGKQGRFFMTTSSSWTSIFPVYLEAVKTHFDDLAQQPGQDTTLTTICDGLGDKMGWVSMTHGAFHYAPPMPMMTRSAISMVAGSLRDVELAIYEYCTWFDWSAPYNNTRPVKTNAKDISAAVIRTILANNQKRWERPQQVVNIFVFFIWENLDLFVGMQQYLTEITKSIERPAFKEVNGTKIQDAMPLVFSEDTTETFNAMIKVKNGSKGVITTGLWPLDHESYYDWRHSTHKASVWKQWIHMARIEKIFVGRYRPKMLKKCASARLIREKLELLLSPLCSPTIATSLSKSDDVQRATFIWPDKIKVVKETPAVGTASASKPVKGRQATTVSEDRPRHVDVHNVKTRQLLYEETDAMLAEITAIFKRLHSSKAALAVRGQEGFYKPILDKMNGLEADLITNIYRSEHIQEVAAATPSLKIDPYDNVTWAPLEDFEDLSIPKRAQPFVVVPPPSKQSAKTAQVSKAIEREASDENTQEGDGEESDGDEGSGAESGSRETGSDTSDEAPEETAYSQPHFDYGPVEDEVDQTMVPNVEDPIQPSAARLMGTIHVATNVDVAGSSEPRRSRRIDLRAKEGNKTRSLSAAPVSESKSKPARRLPPTVDLREPPLSALTPIPESDDIQMSDPPIGDLDVQFSRMDPGDESDPIESTQDDGVHTPHGQPISKRVLSLSPETPVKKRIRRAQRSSSDMDESEDDRGKVPLPPGV